jgi:RNA polymerase sigma factor (sigma-70 family)
MNEMFDSLYNRHKDTVYKYVLVSLGFNHDMADDCMQDILMVLLQKHETILAHPNPGGFFIVTARNFIKRYKTAQYNHARRTAPLDEKVNHLSYQVDFQEIFNTMPDTEILKKRIIERLNDKEAGLYELFYERGFSVADTAQRLHLSESNVKVRLFRLRNKVRQMVKEIIHSIEDNAL